MELSYQLYSSRNWPLENTMQMLSDAGYREVEGVLGLMEDVGAFKALADKHGLAVTSTHMALEALEEDIVGCVAAGKDLGTKRIYAPYLTEDKRPKDRAGWDALATRLAKVQSQIETAGFIFGWHNHDFELVDLGGGHTPLDCLAAAGVPFELDLGWVHFAGHDVVATIEKYGHLITTAHIKDRAPAGENADEDGWADVGAGVMDWASIHAALKTAGVTHYVIEHDNPSDHARFARASFDHMTSL